jgi:hypothetical protein
MNEYIKELIQYGALGVICIGMGYMIFKYWQADRAEKQRLIDRLEKLNDELRQKK